MGRFMNLKDRVTLFKVETSLPKARKLDRRAARAVDEKYGSSGAGNFHKILLSKEFLAPIKKIVADFLKYRESVSLPFDSPYWILKVPERAEFKKKYREAKDQFDGEVAAAKARLPEEIRRAEVRLGETLFDPKELPNSKWFEREFRFDIEEQPISSTEDLRIHLSDEELAVVERNFTRKFREATDTVYEKIDNAVTALAKGLAKMGDDDGEGRGRPTTAIQNLRDLVAVLPTLNITDDERLTEMARKIESEITRHDLGHLKESEDDRKDVQDSVNELLAKLDGYNG